MNFARVYDCLREVMGLDADSLGKASLHGAVRRRMRACEVDTPEAYAERLRTDPVEFDRLSVDVVVHETSFFRYASAFDLLAREALAHLQPSKETVFRIGCVACSTGEEPASAVMALLQAGLEPERIVVDASDVSERAIAYAERGVYRRRGVQRLPEDLRARWFQEQEDGFLLDGAVRARIRYRTANALAPSFEGERNVYDAVFCRNLLIYLVPDARERLLGTLGGMLRPSGLLFVGHAEVAAVRAMGLPVAGPTDAFASRSTPAGPPAAPRMPRAVVPPRPTPRWKGSAISPPPRPAPIERSTPATRRTRQDEGLRQAEALANAGDLPGARTLIEQAVARGLAGAAHFHLLALVESANAEDHASEAALRRALYLEPEHYPSLVQMALLAETRGDLSRAARLKAKAERVRESFETARERDSVKGGRRGD